MKSSRLLFVYGTLMQGEVNHALLEGQTFIGRARTVAAFELVDCGDYPALVSGGRTAVHGEIWAVDDGALDEIDELEQHPDLYRRTAIEVLPQGGVAMRMMEAYVLPAHHTQGLRRIATGDWRNSTASSERRANVSGGRRR